MAAMRRHRFALVVAFLVMLLGAASGTRTRADRMPDEPTRARPANRCQITGNHVSGAVAVELGDGRRAELMLVDVRAIVAVEPALSDVQVYVTSPLSFAGRFVSRDLGGPGAYASRAYRSGDGRVRLAARVPFEIALASDPSMASVRLPSPFGDGALLVTVPCSVLSAGTPRVDMLPPPIPRRLQLVTLRPGTRVLSETGGHGSELARVEGAPGASEPIQFEGRTGPAVDGFAPVSLRVGPARIEGFVPASNVDSLGAGGGPVAHQGGYGVSVRSLNHFTRARLPVGTAIFANAAQPGLRAWASVTAPLDVFLGNAAAGERAAVVLASEEIGNHPCRFDGVAGRVPCGNARQLPPLSLSLTRCTGSTCAPVAFVMRP